MVRAVDKADSFQRSIILGAIYHFTIYLRVGPVGSGKKLTGVRPLSVIGPYV